MMDLYHFLPFLTFPIDILNESYYSFACCCHLPKQSQSVTEQITKDGSNSSFNFL